jgi:hypothetical protein
LDSGGGQVVLYGVIELAGRLFQHTLGVLLLCWQRMLRFGLSVGVLSFLMAEVLGAALTRQFPPSILTTVVALIVAFALGYAAALTALADELLISAMDTVRLLEGDTRAGLRVAAVAAEREAGEARQGLLRWLGHPPAPKAATALSVAGVADHIASSSAPVASETLEDVAATERFQSSSARNPVNARPVRADQLPRIPWAYEQDGDNAAPEVGGAPPTEMPPLPLRVPDVAPLAAPSDGLTTGNETVAAMDDPAATLPSARKPEAPPAALVSTTTAVAGGAGATAPSAPDASGDRSIWARIGQALVGNTMPLAALGGTHAAASPSNRPRGTGDEARAGAESREDAPSGGQRGQSNEV